MGGHQRFGDTRSFLPQARNNVIKIPQYATSVHY